MEPLRSLAPSQTFLFSVLNGVVFSEKSFRNLRKEAEAEAVAQKKERGAQGELGASVGAASEEKWPACMRKSREFRKNIQPT